MDTPQHSPALAVTVQPVRYVPALINGVSAAIPCEPWCRVDHIAANPRYIEDVTHSSDPVRLDLAAGTTPLTLVEARLSADPASDRPASVFVEEHSTGQGRYLDADAADAFADQLDAFAASFRAMAAQLRGDR
ncbi:hypothetical protein [Streptomyces sp. MJP52]|uniref:DUF6907 domain-containing protein n=1 Tax=Streptomyces sp. MJP52 TaxID=2940555 RepID=UPI0024764309|nr:hypothetical protein [Streptomyces sp. MJP52]MDH6224333.1 hypothetical protein [Streptomyces sp. MJP52]